MTGRAAQPPQQQAHSAPRQRGGPCRRAPPSQTTRREASPQHPPKTQPNPGPNQVIQARAAGTQSQVGRLGRSHITGPARATWTELPRSSTPTTTRPQSDPSAGQAQPDRAHQPNQRGQGVARPPAPQAPSIPEVRPQGAGGEKQSTRFTQGAPPRPMVAHRSPGGPGPAQDKIGHS
ncbi:hypothetical protein NDU88_007214 [Pleurodeles waltl]|uniref:Uncharacterized protein n=1 Tax=Pleurodeles waltl TaxID=8319 RepID=A0AAV7SRW1_PLEWA|nr:hypothetical protein NDU88_007214 [Pleurodeles waltl]